MPLQVQWASTLPDVKVLLLPLASIVLAYPAVIHMPSWDSIINEISFHILFDRESDSATSAEQRQCRLGGCKTCFSSFYHLLTSTLCDSPLLLPEACVRALQYINPIASPVSTLSANQ